VASAFPVAFLSNPLVYLLLRLCLILEASGICSAAWVLALIHKRIAGYQVDEVYIGTPEERAAKESSDENDEELHVLEAGQPRVPTPPFGTHPLPYQTNITAPPQEKTEVEYTQVEVQSDSDEC
jgi:hypothetical protein